MSSRINFLSPLPLAIGGVLVLLVGVLIYTFTGGPEKTKTEASLESKLSSKSHSRPRQNDIRSDHKGKSEGKTDEERYKHLSPEEFQEVVANLSASARDELKLLREKYATEFDDPDERRAFAVQLGQISDPSERNKARTQRAAEIQRARRRAEASKTAQDRMREKQLLALMQVHNLNRMSHYVAQNPSLAEAARDFDTKLVQWVRDHESMNQAVFHQTFNKLRAEVTSLRMRHAQQRKEGLAD